MTKLISLIVSHGLMLAVGFALGIYTLPILLAPPSPSMEEVMEKMEGSRYTATFKHDLDGSDFLHRGKGEVLINEGSISFMGKLAPGPDYKLYLSPMFVENEAEFRTVKSQSALIGDVKTFDRFILSLPESVDPAQYTTAVIWCERFGEFITAGAYR